MTKLDAAQEAHLKAFESAYGLYVTANRELRAQMEAELEERVHSLRIDASKAANRAVKLGKVPVSRLGDKGRGGMQTKNYNTIQKFLALSDGLVQETAEDLYVDPRSLIFSFTGNDFTVTLTGDDLTFAFRAWDRPPGESEAVRLGLDTGQFAVRTRDDGSRFVEPLTERWMPEYGESHPVVTWMDLPANERAALDYHQTL